MKDSGVVVREVVVVEVETPSVQAAEGEGMRTEW